MQSAPTKLRHVEERLAERAPPAAAERGFALLRDRAALARFLARQRRRSDALASADRIALPLAPGDGAPHILVTPDGKGVTCLGPGMAFAAPVVPFAEVKRHLDEEQERLRAEITFRRVQRGPEASSPITRLIRYPHRVTREEFLALRELTPILLRFYRKVVREEVTFFLELMRRRRRLPKKRAHRAVFFQLYYSAAIALMAAGHDEGMFRLLLAAASCGDTLLAPRALWHLVHQPERTLARAEEAKDLFEGNFDLYGALVLPAIAARFPAWRKDTAATLNRLARGTPHEEEARRLAPKLLELDPENRTLWQGLLFALPIALSRIAPPEVAESDFQACFPVMQAKAEDAGAGFFDLARIMGPFVEARAKEMRILEGLRAPVRLLPRSERELDDEERLRIQNYRAVWLGTKTPLAHCHPVLPILLASTPIEALTPSDDPRRDLSPSDGADYIGNVLPEVLRAYAGRHRPVEATEKSPGRNAPCPCGSGQKYKRCCGAA